MKIAFTLCSINYLAQAKTLGDSLLTHNPEYTFIVGLVDKLIPDARLQSFPYQLVQVSDMDLLYIQLLLSETNQALSLIQEA